MLNAFTARSVIELGAKDKRRVESTAISGDKLLLGLNTGSLLVYRLSSGKRSSEVPTEVEKFARGGIKQLGIVKESNLLVALSDNYVSLYDLQDLQLREQLTHTKGATTFAVTSTIIKDGESEIPAIQSRLAVGVRKRLSIWKWSDPEAAADVRLDVTLPSAIRSITWGKDNTLICGLAGGFVRVNVSSQEVSEIQSGQERFGSTTTTGMGYVGMAGWGPKPLATALGENGMLLSKDINSLFIDNDGRPTEKRQVPWTAAPDATAFSYPYLLTLQTSRGLLEVRNPETLALLQSLSLPNATLLYVPSSGVSLAHGGKGFIVASDRNVWRMESVGYDAQVDELVDKGEFDEAISLLDLLEDALLENKEAKTRDIKIKKALTLFERKQYTKSLALFTTVSAPPELVIKLYPPAISGSLNLNGDVKEPMSPKRGGKRLSDSSARSIIGDKPSSDLDGKDLQDAVIELCSFLVQTRTKLKRFITPEGLQSNGNQIDIDLPFIDENKEKSLRASARLVDTTLFRAYMLARPSLAGPLFRLPNFCDPDVVNEKLQETKRFTDLIDFFRTNKLYQPALELLKRFGAVEDSAAPTLFGPEPTVYFLQSLPPSQVNLILEFVRWPLRADPKLAMEVFLADSENAETLPRGRVAEFLQEISPTFAQQYLEHVTLELKDMTPDFHNKLVNSYLAEKGSPESREKLLSFLRTSREYSPSRAYSALPKEDPNFYEVRAVVLSRLGQHKQALEMYVFSMQDYEKAEKYCNEVYLLPDPRTRKDDEPPPSIYHTLLSLYLAPNTPHKPNFEAALDLLSRHGSRLPASSTLGLIPATFPVKDLEYYFLHRIRAANSVVNEGRIVKRLTNLQAADAQAMLLLGDGTFRGRNRHVTIDENRVCRVCHKRLGLSLISIQPEYVVAVPFVLTSSNSVVHLGCAGERQHRRLSGL